jgi:hypothetical protein
MCDKTPPLCKSRGGAKFAFRTKYSAIHDEKAAPVARSAEEFSMASRRLDGMQCSAAEGDGRFRGSPARRAARSEQILNERSSWRGQAVARDLVKRAVAL